MPACKRSRGPNSRKLPLISNNSALGGSMLTNEVNRCAYKQRRCSTAAACSMPANSGNTTAYHSCRERTWPAACGVGGMPPAFNALSASLCAELSANAGAGAGTGAGASAGDAASAAKRSPWVLPLRAPTASAPASCLRIQGPPRSTGPGRPPCTLSRSRRVSCSPCVINKRRLAGEDSKR